MLDICKQCDHDNKIRYVWYDTGLEYQATKEHLIYLEEKYGIKIERIKAFKPIPTCCHAYGQPFLSKRVSDMVERMQNKNIPFDDRPYEELMKKYPNSKTELRWWCNQWGDGSMFNISRNKWLKQFMIENPPLFKISDKCCDFAKKKVLHNYIKQAKIELNIFGVRKAEGGRRTSVYHSCFSNNRSNKCDEYRPLFWYSNNDKIDYENCYGIIHSRCYTEYGLKRTGCAGCPFGRKFEEELEIIKRYEPKLFVAVNHIFKDSYEYTRRYREFQKMMNEKQKKESES